MTKRPLFALLVLAPIVAIIAAAAPAHPAPTPDDDIVAIKKNTTAFTAAWNSHNAKALAALWAKDGDLIDPWGVTSVGRDAVEKFFTQQHTKPGPLAAVTYDNKSDAVRLITPDVAVEDWQVILTGLIGPDGKAMGPQMHHVVIVLKKEGTPAQWRIAAARPGVPSPVAAPEAAPSKQTK